MCSPKERQLSYLVLDFPEQKLFEELEKSQVLVRMSRAPAHMTLPFLLTYAEWSRDESGNTQGIATEKRLVVTGW